jgi:predicted HAD superfamily Cof-like phosphohydrolase
MDNNQVKVKEFMDIAGQAAYTAPTFPEDAVQFLRLAILQEEFLEYEAAVINRDMTEVADALTDMLYVIYGTANAYGLDMEMLFDEVHRSNMSKFVDGKAVFNAIGKVTKGYRYSPPNIDKCIAKMYINDIVKEIENETETNRQPSLF